jgi:hypothetical protein
MYEVHEYVHIIPRVDQVRVHNGAHAKKRIEIHATP